METITLIINGESFVVKSGATVAAAVLNAGGMQSFRRSVTGKSRVPLCGMGICFECRVTINSVRHQRSCQIAATDGMRVETDE